MVLKYFLSTVHNRAKIRYRLRTKNREHLRKALRALWYFLGTFGRVWRILGVMFERFLEVFWWCFKEVFRCNEAYKIYIPTLAQYYFFTLSFLLIFLVRFLTKFLAGFGDIFGRFLVGFGKVLKKEKQP